MSNISLVVVSIPLAGVSTIACTIGLGVLLYYKMWQKFIYRLVLYIFVSLIALSLSTISLMSFDLPCIAGPGTNETASVAVRISIVFVNSSLAIYFMLATSVTVCIYLMALHNYQFTYKSDICLTIPSILYLTITALVMTIYYLDIHHLKIIVTSLVSVSFVIKIVFTVLVLMPLCCRACGYDLCMKTAATIESHRKALREILPLFILIVPYFLFFVLWMLLVLYINVFLYSVVLYSILGMVSAFSFTFHFCCLKKNLKKLRSKSTNRQPEHTHHTTVYTNEGLSETCNTEFIVVSESLEDTRYLLNKKN